MFLNSSMMVTTFIFYLTLIHVSSTIYGPRLLISHIGGTVTIKCYYLTIVANKYDRKYWCKESKFSHGHCQTIVSTNDFILQGYEGKVSIEDIHQKGILKVTMTQLQKEDSSNYRCGIGKINSGLYTGVNLTVVKGPNLPKSPEVVWGKLSGSVMIQCPLETTKLSIGSSLCKISRSGCTPIVDKSRHKWQDGRIIFTMVDSLRMLNVIINKLRTQDSGMYSCGMRTLDDFSRMVQLQVIEESVFSNIVSEINATYEPQTTYTLFHEYIGTSADEVSKERSSHSEQNLLSIVIPVIVVLLAIAATATIVLIKIKQQRKYASCGIPARECEVEMPLNSPKHPEEQCKQESRASVEEQESTVVSDKVDTPISSIYCLISKKPDLKDSQESV